MLFLIFCSAPLGELDRATERSKAKPHRVLTGRGGNRPSQVGLRNKGKVREIPSLAPMSSRARLEQGPPSEQGVCEQPES